MGTTTAVNFRMDTDTKKQMEQVCKKMGITMTQALNMFANRVVKDGEIPFEISTHSREELMEKDIKRLFAYQEQLNALAERRKKNEE